MFDCFASIGLHCFRLPLLVQIMEPSPQPAGQRRDVAHLSVRLGQAPGPPAQIVRWVLVDPLHVL